MAHNWIWREKFGCALSLMSLAAVISSCDEALPARIEPQGALEITYVSAAQGTGPGGIHITIAVDVQNTYEETFAGQINVKGNIHIWWKKRPHIEANVPINHRANLLRDPGERHFIIARWLLMTDDREDVLEMLDYSGGDVRLWRGLRQTGGIRHGGKGDALRRDRLSDLRASRVYLAGMGTGGVVTAVVHSPQPARVAS